MGSDVDLLWPFFLPLPLPLLPGSPPWLAGVYGLTVPTLFDELSLAAEAGEELVHPRVAHAVRSDGTSKPRARASSRST